MTVRHVVGLSLQKSWSCCLSVLGGITRKKNWSCGWFWRFCWSYCLEMWWVCSFVGHRLENDCKKASVGVVGSEIEISEQIIDKIRSV